MGCGRRCGAEELGIFGDAAGVWRFLVARAAEISISDFFPASAISEISRFFFADTRNLWCTGLYWSTATAAGATYTVLDCTRRSAAECQTTHLKGLGLRQPHSQPSVPTCSRRPVTNSVTLAPRTMGARRARTRAMPVPCASHAPGSDFRPDFAQIFFREVKSRLI